MSVFVEWAYMSLSEQFGPMTKHHIQEDIISASTLW